CSPPRSPSTPPGRVRASPGRLYHGPVPTPVSCRTSSTGLSTTTITDLGGDQNLTNPDAYAAYPSACRWIEKTTTAQSAGSNGGSNREDTAAVSTAQGDTQWNTEVRP